MMIPSGFACVDDPVLSAIEKLTCEDVARILRELVNELDKPPTRVQLRRTRGWRLPAGAVIVDRRTKWGNPISWTTFPKYQRDEDGGLVRVADSWNQHLAVVYFEAELLGWDGTPPGTVGDRPYPTADEIRRELAGRDLACWCPLTDRCHADVLLKIANGGR